MSFRGSSADPSRGALRDEPFLLLLRPRRFVISLQYLNLLNLRVLFEGCYAPAPLLLVVYYASLQLSTAAAKAAYQVGQVRPSPIIIYRKSFFGFF